jgi:hypothetical protein
MTDLENSLRRQLDREREVIHAMQRRYDRPFPFDILQRKPWRSPDPNLYLSNQHSLRVNVRNLYQWLRYAHDCADPSVGCACSGGFRFPHPGKEK